MWKICLLIIPFFILSCQHRGYNIRDNNANKHEILIEILDKAKKEFNIPALCVIILKSDTIIDKAVIGVRNINSNETATFDNSFHLGSNTKAFTSFIAGKLVDEGKISWNTKYFDLFPELKSVSRKEYYLITLSDLLSHRARVLPALSGKQINKIPVSNGNIQDKRIKFCEYILKEKPVKSSPQSLFKNYAYSNAGYVLAAAMLEKVSSKSWEELVREIFVNDLKLFVNAGWPIDINDNQPRGHLPGSYTGEKNDKPMIYDKEYHYKNDDVLNPAGHLNINVLDYVKFIQLHLQGLKGMDNYLSSSTYQYMHFGISQYSMGWENSKNNISSHSGSSGNFFCHAYIDKEKDMAIIVFANSGILNALNVFDYFCGGIKFNNYLTEIKKLYNI